MPTKKKHLLDPFTHEKREITGAAKKEKLDAEEKIMRGINPAIMKSIPSELKAIRTEGTRKGYPAQLVLHHEAEKLDELASRWTDHQVNAIKSVGIKMTPHEEREMWEKGFDQFIERMVRKLPIKHVSKIIEEIDSIREYTRLPKIVHIQRTKRHQTFSRIINDLLERKVNPELNLLRNVEKTLSRKTISKERKKQTQNKLKAIDICIAASIYADLKIAQAPRGQPTSWMRHYQNGIHLVWESSKLPDHIATAIKQLER